MSQLCGAAMKRFKQLLAPTFLLHRNIRWTEKRLRDHLQILA
jgi:hypothetical protein